MSPSVHGLSLRARLMTIGLIGVAAALAIGSVTLYGVLTLLSYRTLDDTARATVSEVGDLVVHRRLPDPIPVTGSQIVQVVDGQDRVVSASTSADRLTVLLRAGELRRALAGEAVVVPGSRIGLGSPLRVVAGGVATPGLRRTVLVAQQFDDVRRSQQILGLTLLVTAPLLLAVIGLIAWRVLTAALGPVEALRASAERISGAEEDTRLPVPASRDEIHALAVTLNSMLDRLAGSRARQRAFVADAAHELRSPLASMQTQLDVARRLGEQDPGGDDLRAEVERMTALVDDLLVLARLDAATGPSSPAGPVDVASLLAEVATRRATTRVPVVVRDGEVAPARGHHDDLARALGNLVDNAVRHARTRVALSAHAEGDRVVLTVEDDGSGIPAAERERVFERFTRLDEGRARDAGGSGLGMAIARELVARDGGTVRLGDAAPGLRAEVVLPRG
ncbi:MAG: sensor histidine kinase [Nocardioides sp.]